MPDRIEIGSAAGAAGSAIVAGFSYLSGSVFLTAVLAALAGSLLTVYFTGAQQKKAWKREIAIRMTTDLYGPLYQDIWRVIQAFSRDQSQGTMASDKYQSELWPMIVGDYRYLNLPDDMKSQLDEFYVLVEKTSLQWVDLTNLGMKIVVAQTGQAMGLNITGSLDWVVRCTLVGRPPYEQAFHPSIAIARGRPSWITCVGHTLG